MPTQNLRRSIWSKLILSLFSLCLAAAVAQTAQNQKTDAAGLVGTWHMSSETPNGDPVQWTLTVSETNGKWSGTIGGIDEKTIPAGDFKVSGNKVHFTAPYEGSSYDIDLTLENGTLSGTWNGEGGSGKTSGKRST